MKDETKKDVSVIAAWLFMHIPHFAFTIFAAMSIWLLFFV